MLFGKTYGYMVFLVKKCLILSEIIDIIRFVLSAQHGEMAELV